MEPKMDRHATSLHGICTKRQIRKTSIICIIGFVTALLVVPLSGTARAGDVCADFSLFPDNAPLPAKFSLAGFDFELTDSAHPWFVNETKGERGLQFNMK